VHKSEKVVLDGSLTIADLVGVARDPSMRVERTPQADKRVADSAKKVVDLVERARVANEQKNLEDFPREYGITTGFGEFKNKLVPYEKLSDLQWNLLRSHAVGVGENTNPDDLANYFSAEVVRATLLVRMNAFLQGYSGVRVLLVDILQAMLNCGVIPLVPIRGSVGASGDLCPLSHLFVTLLGEGRFYRVVTPEDLENTRPEIRSAKDDARGDLLSVLREVMPALTWEDMAPQPKEGLALNNGANFSAAMLALGVHDALVLADAADVAVAMTLEAICGCTRALDPKVHEARQHQGQIDSAQRVRELLLDSKLVELSQAVQDAYSVRCAPQVHGASLDAIRYVAGVATREINAATDNPLFFDGEPWDVAHYGKRGLQRVSYSAGNFHGQPIALAADFLTIALAELANISERRIQMLLDGNQNRELPPNLTTEPGLNSGFMIAQYTAAGLVSENKVLSHPASVDSIPTSANSEDHVSMSTHAARKMRTVLGNAQSVIAIEILVASQALEWRALGVPSRFEKATKEVDEEEWHPKDWDGATKLAVRFRKLDRSAVVELIAPALRPVYSAIRKKVEPLLEDNRTLEKDIWAVRALIATKRLNDAS
jgi:histidine ammonia-lyase